MRAQLLFPTGDASIMQTGARKPGSVEHERPHSGYLKQESLRHLDWEDVVHTGTELPVLAVLYEI